MEYLEQIQVLKQFGNIPIRTEVLRSVLSAYKSPEKKIDALVSSGAIIRLKRGLFVVSPEISGKPLSKELIANHLYSPSYVSLHYGLRFYGLIPEHVVLLTSVTTLHTQRFSTPVGNFSYRGVPKDYFPIGIRMEEEAGIKYLIATPEKALCDMIMVERYVPSQSISALEAFFEEDMRIEIDDLKQMNRDIIRRCMEMGNKKHILANLLKLIER